MVQAAAVVPTYAPEDLLTLCVHLLLHFVHCRRIRSDNSVRVKSVTVNVSEECEECECEERISPTVTVRSRVTEACQLCLTDACVHVMPRFRQRVTSWDLCAQRKFTTQVLAFCCACGWFGFPSVCWLSGGGYLPVICLVICISLKSIRTEVGVVFPVRSSATVPSTAAASSLSRSTAPSHPSFATVFSF